MKREREGEREIEKGRNRKNLETSGKKVIFIFVNTKTSEFVVSEEQTERNVCVCV